MFAGISTELVTSVILMLLFVGLVGYFVTVGLVGKLGNVTINKTVAYFGLMGKLLSGECELGELEEYSECMVCTELGYLPSDEICKEKYGEGYFCDRVSGKCKESRCEIPCESGYQCVETEEGWECLPRKNTCPEGGSCRIYLQSTFTIPSDAHAYILVFERKDDYTEKLVSILHCEKASDTSFSCEVPAWLLKGGKCYQGLVYYPLSLRNSKDIFEDGNLFCVIPEGGSNEITIKIGRVEEESNVIDSFGCWKDGHSSKCKVKLSHGFPKKVRVFFLGYNESGVAVSPISEYFNSGVLDPGEKKLEVTFLTFERFSGKKVRVFSLLLDEQKDVVGISPPSQPVEEVCARKKETCSWPDIFCWSTWFVCKKPCCIEEERGMEMACIDGKCKL